MSSATRFLLLLALIGLADAFMTTSGLPALRKPAARSTCAFNRLSMQEGGPPAKQTTGFGKMFTNIIEKAQEPTERIDENGKRTLKANEVQIFMMISAQFGIPILLIQIYKAIKGM